jgi:hypothetical protein
MEFEEIDTKEKVQTLVGHRVRTAPNVQTFDPDSYPNLVARRADAKGILIGQTHDGGGRTVFAIDHEDDGPIAWYDWDEFNPVP